MLFYVVMLDQVLYKYSVTKSALGKSTFIVRAAEGRRAEVSSVCAVTRLRGE